jgi:2-octaprenyl-6-methoxyphenol hydroxylase
MKRQKICIIGGSLTGLVTAISLSKLNCDIDLIIGNTSPNVKSNRTVAVSENNFHFLNKLNISKSFKKILWPCSIMKLYTEVKNGNFSEVFELNNNNKKKNILYMLENSKMTKIMLNKIKKIKSISVQSHKRIYEIVNSGLLKSVKFDNSSPKYNLIIICTGSNSELVKNVFKDQVIENSYREVSATTILSHESIKNNMARQIFLNNDILALLPISNNKTSIVFSVKKNIIRKNDLLLKKKIKFYAEKYLKKIKFLTKIEYRDLNFLVRNKYYKERTLLFGDALHVVHPFAGQGFNMTLRDLVSLEKILSKKINLGLDIGSSDILSEFSDEIKPRNFVFSVGVDLLKNSFEYKKLRNNLLKVLNKSNFAKNLIFNIADNGLRF